MVERRDLQNVKIQFTYVSLALDPVPQFCLFPNEGQLEKKGANVKQLAKKWLIFLNLSKIEITHWGQDAYQMKRNFMLNHNEKGYIGQKCNFDPPKWERGG